MASVSEFKFFNLFSNISESFEPEIKRVLFRTPSSLNLTQTTTLEFTTSKVTLFLILVLFNVWIILGNFLTIIGILKKNSEKVPTDCYLINLSICDIFLGFLVLPLMIGVVVLDYFPFSSSICNGWVYFDYFLIVVSAYGYAAIFLNHFSMVRIPSKCKNSLQFHVLCIGFLWIAANFSWAPGYIHNTEMEQIPGLCGYVIQSSSYYTMYVSITGFYIPLLISIIGPIYAAFLLRSNKSHNRLFYNTGGSQIIPRNNESMQTKKQRKWTLDIIMETNQILATRNQARKEQPLILALLASFFLSRILFYVYFGVGAFISKGFPPDLSDGVYWVMHSNAAICPIIHFILEPELREGIARSFRCSYWRSREAKEKDASAITSLSVSSISPFVPKLQNLG